MEENLKGRSDWRVQESGSRCLRELCISHPRTSDRWSENRRILGVSRKNIYTDVCSKRTTNGSEAFHRKLNCLFYASHPSVFELVDRLQEIVFDNSFKFRDGPSRPAKLSDRKKHDWMKSSIAEYVDGSLTTHAFLRRICNASLPRTNLHWPEWLFNPECK